MKTILVIEDEVDLSLMYKMRLEHAGYQVVQAFDGEQGLLLARTIKPNLIILDLKLPLLDGINVCEQLKGDEKFKQIPIIIVSARKTEYEKGLGLSLGAEAYLTKPYEAAELLARIKELVR